MAFRQGASQRSVAAVFFLCMLLNTCIPGSEAQIALDSSFGLPTALRGPDYVISANMGRLRGPNLYHSFARFNIQRGESATFTGPDTVENIIGRVTGGEASFIDGLLKSDIVDANVFLFNPHGVIFGANARLDVSGSFHVSTADYLRLADGERFFARLSERSVLSVAAPAAFGFLGSPSPAAITMTGSDLEVPEGEALSVTGGEIRIVGGTLVAPGGRIQIAGVAAAGESPVHLSGTAESSGVGSFERLAAVDIVGSSRLDVSGDGGGEVVIRGGRLLVSNSSIAADTLGDVDGAEVAVDMRVTDEIVVTQRASITANVGSLETFIGGTGNAGDIRVQAGRVEISDNATVFALAVFADGERGDILVTAEKLQLMGGASLDTSSLGSGGGGNITIQAMEEVMIAGRNADDTASSIVSNNFGGTAQAGRLTIMTPTLMMDDGLIQSRTIGAGNAGEIILSVGRLSLLGGAQISSSTGGSGQGGTVTVDATEMITIAGRDVDNFASGILSAAADSGDGGRVTISTPRLILEDGFISASTEGRAENAGQAGEVNIAVERLNLLDGAQITSATEGAGDGGTVTIQATEAILLAGRNSEGTGSRIDSSTVGEGAAGRLVIDTPDLTIEARGGIQALTEGAGNAGEIALTVGTLTLRDGAKITSSTSASGQGGTITVEASEAITIAGRDISGAPSRIDSSTQSGSGNAGRLRVSAPTLVLDDHGSIQASTTGAGNAGEIVVAVETLTLSGGAQISSSTAGAGTGGTVTVQATNTIKVTGSTARAPSQLVSTTAATGEGGNLHIAAQHLELDNGGRVAADSTGLGNAGTIDITLAGTFRSHDSRVTTASAQAGGGNITLAAERVHMTRSALTATVLGGAGGGGDVTIRATAVTLNNSQIIAQADLGRGGNIDIVAEDILLADPTSLIDASAERGIDGTVDIQSPVINVSSSLAPLSQTFSKTSLLLSERCANRVASSQASRFVISGRDSVPIEPGGVLPSPVASMESILQPPHAAGTIHTASRAAAAPQAPEVGDPSLTPEQSELLKTTFANLEQECGKWLWKIEN